MSSIVHSKTKLTNPFKGIEKTGDFRRISTSVSTEHYQMLRRIRPDGGTIDGMINQLYCKLINQLLARGITDYTQLDRFEDFVMRSVLVLPEELDNNVTQPNYEPAKSYTGPTEPDPRSGPRESQRSPLPKTEAPNVPPGTPGGDQPYSSPPGQPPSLPSDGKKHRKVRRVEGEDNVSGKQSV